MGLYMGSRPAPLAAFTPAPLPVGGTSLKLPPYRTSLARLHDYIGPAPQPKFGPEGGALHPAPPSPPRLPPPPPPTDDTSMKCFVLDCGNALGLSYSHKLVHARWPRPPVRPPARLPKPSHFVPPLLPKGSNQNSEMQPKGAAAWAAVWLLPGRPAHLPPAGASPRPPLWQLLLDCRSAREPVLSPEISATGSCCRQSARPPGAAFHPCPAPHWRAG